MKGFLKFIKSVFVPVKTKPNFSALPMEKRIARISNDEHFRDYCFFIYTRDLDYRMDMCEKFASIELRDLPKIETEKTKCDETEIVQNIMKFYIWLDKKNHKDYSFINKLLNNIKFFTTDEKKLMKGQV